MLGPVLVRLLLMLPVEVLRPLAFETRRAGAEAAPAPTAPDTALLGLVVEFPRGVMAMFLKAVTGGSGRGLLFVDGVATVLCRLIGDSLRAVIRTGAMEDF